MKIYTNNTNFIKTSFGANNRLDYLYIDAAKHLQNTKEWDVCYYHKYPFNILCNFYPTNFSFDNIKINSMEGFLQALKTKDVKEQDAICKLFGEAAKKVGNYYKNQNIFDRNTLYWNGKSFNRYSQEYNNLLEKVYDAKYNADSEFRNILQLTNGYKLTHRIGKTDKNDTVLTEKEFMDCLNHLRKQNKPQKETINNILNLHSVQNMECKSVKDLDKFNISDMHCISDKLVVGTKVTSGYYKKYLSTLKDAGIDTIISINNGNNDTEISDLCKKYNLSYYNIKYKTTEELAEQSSRIIDLFNNKKVYIEFNNTPAEVNTILGLNYVFNPKSNITNAILMDGIKDEQEITVPLHNLYELIKNSKQNVARISQNELIKKIKVLINMNVKDKT